MAIERKNSFHLLLSDDELKLLRLLAEREGQNASDYLRLLLRRQTDSARDQLRSLLQRGTGSLALGAVDDPVFRRALLALYEDAGATKKKRP
jgi:hypothetical protein